MRKWFQFKCSAQMCYPAIFIGRNTSPSLEIRYTHANFMQRLILFFIFVIVVFTAQCAESTVKPTPVVTNLPTETPVIGVSLETVVPPTAVFIQTTATPLPTPTATPPPTPIVHLVQEGETLLEIALLNDTTVEGITAVNPGMNPDFLQIGQAVVLPPPSTPLAQEVQGTAVPVQVTVSQVQTYQTSVGSLWVIGEVLNEGSLPVEQVQVNGSLLDDGGEVVASFAVWTAVSLIQPGSKAPFGVLMPEVPADVGRPVVSIAGGSTVVDLGSRSVDVVVLETAVSSQSERVELTGSIKNNGEQSANRLIITATFYNDRGDITGFQQQLLSQTLQAGETAVFTLNAAPPGNMTSHAAVSVEAAVVISEN